MKNVLARLNEHDAKERKARITTLKVKYAKSMLLPFLSYVEDTYEGHDDPNDISSLCSGAYSVLESDNDDDAARIFLSGVCMGLADAYEGSHRQLEVILRDGALDLITRLEKTNVCREYIDLTNKLDAYIQKPIRVIVKDKKTGKLETRKETLASVDGLKRLNSEIGRPYVAFDDEEMTIKEIHLGDEMVYQYDPMMLGSLLILQKGIDIVKQD